ncbi:DUF3800 domain-containing protein [Limnothrix sp. FACHB-708]|uniref:DUF3800 domain-containing protein n=1 Tax=unclassified Limnothrix TaxID=2632864 RepID=UPI00168458F7|nr:MULTISPECIES: DUF3800 domain-containing protein [unclassified Limnothrix]MBD2554777.1 DUF3800 domain-containing protein [Limnothrix sp. FACHB-708]MBD2591984.1 DUF3800 domain-containing protein [Limnothrix sp. FACHB-406]
MTIDSETHHYFVDEAGDLTFFNKKGRVIIGQPGASRFFMVGIAQIADPEVVARELESLRLALINNPRYKDIPSMQPQAQKTVVTFHAKDDYAEIREQVFELMQSFDVKIYVAIRSKIEIAQRAQDNFKNLNKKLQQNSIYDDLIKRLFKDRLHKANFINITIARRGKEAREEALGQAINQARKNFESRWNISANGLISIESTYPSQSPGLQIIDYYLWALQRFYEREEDRFFKPLAPKYRLIMDLDDKRHKDYGEWYSDRNPLTAEKMREARSR